MDATTVAEIGKNTTLEILIGVLEATDRDLRRLWAMDGNEEEYQQAYERHWALRAIINATPARTFSELRAKARAAEIELERDAADCEGPGSFIELSRSIIADLKAMELASKESILRVVPGAGQ